MARSKPLFSSACFFRIADGFELPDLDALEAALRKAAFVPCGPTQPESSGWIAPRGDKSKRLAEVVGGHLILKQQTERRSVPGPTIKAAVAERVERYMRETGNERVPAKLKKEFRGEVLLDLLPRAFPKRSTTTLWLSVKDRLLAVDSGAIGGPADRIVSALLSAMLDAGATDHGADTLQLQFLQPQTSPAAAMAHWLASHEPPWRFTVDRDCELKSSDEQKSVVRYARHILDIEEVEHHVAAGKLPTKLAMTWNDRVSFVLTELGTLRKITMLDVVTAKGEDAEEGFDADVAILTGELSALIPDLLLALDGELGGEWEVAS